MSDLSEKCYSCSIWFTVYFHNITIAMCNITIAMCTYIIIVN